MKNKIVLFSLLLVSILIFQSCGEEKISSSSAFDKTNSHNMGQNCMLCHVPGGSGKGEFIVAGTVYDSTKEETLANVTVNFFSGPQGSGDLVATIEGDAKGNFFTTDEIDFGKGLFPSVVGSEESKFMSSPVMMGNCNSCHGTITDKIWAN